MKKCISLFILWLALVLAIPAVLSGCDPAPSPRGTGSGELGGTLSVYYVETDRLYAEGVTAFLRQFEDELTLEVTAFETAEEMDQRLGTELMSGQGPDVVLFDHATTIDPYKMAASGAFLDLTDRLALSPEDYYTAVAEASVVQGCQYAMPLGFTVLGVCTTEQRMQEAGFDSQTPLTFTSFYDMAAQEDARLAESDAPRYALFFPGRRRDNVLSLCQAGNVPLVDEETGSAVPDRDSLAAICRACRIGNASIHAYLDDGGKARGIANVYERFTFGYLEHPLLPNIRCYRSMYQNAFEEDFLWLVPPTKDGPGHYAACVMQYGAVNAATRNEDAALALLRYLLDYPVTDLEFTQVNDFGNYTMDIPLNRENVQKALTAVQAKSKYKFGFQEASYPVDALPAELASQIGDVLEHVDTAYLPNAALGGLVQDCMKPYLSENGDFDACYEELVSRLDLYAGE